MLEQTVRFLLPVPDQQPASGVSIPRCAGHDHVSAVGGRQKMLEAMPEVRRELDKANLVAGRVDVAEFGHAGFDLQSQGGEQDAEQAEEGLADGSNDEKKSGASRRSSTGAAPTTGPNSQNSGRDGRLHLVV